MLLDGETKTLLRTVYLDGTSLELDPGEEGFFKAETGIQDTDELKKHIIEVQEEAHKASSYSRADWVRRYGGNIVSRSTRILAFVGLDSRSSRLPGCPRTHASSNW